MIVKWKHFSHYWPFVRGIHRSPVNSPHKGQWRGALIFSLICAWTDSWANNGDASDLRRYRAHYDVIAMKMPMSMKLAPLYHASDSKIGLVWEMGNIHADLTQPKSAYVALLSTIGFIFSAINMFSSRCCLKLFIFLRKHCTVNFILHGMFQMPK